MAEAKLPLAGLRVLDLSRLLPGPYCTLILSDLGARVDKLEDTGLGDYLRVMPPLRDGKSGRFNAINRDKRSLAIDLKRPEGRDALLRLLPRYDVLVESFRPGVLDRLGLGWEVLHRNNPRLVQCSISGYGQTGPLRERAGHDLDYVALAGVLGLTGPRGGDPVVPGVQLADLGGGALWAAVGILAALVGAKAIGEGRLVDVSMCEGALAFLLPELGNVDAGAPAPARSDGLLGGGLACYSVYRTKDGRHLAVGALEPKFWLAFNQAIGRRADASEVVLPPAEQERIRAEVQALLDGKTQAEWVELLAAADCCVEPVLTVDEVCRHPQHAARGLFFEIPTKGGGLPQVRTPFGTAEGHTPPPAQGEHTDEILREAGFSDDDIARLRATGVAR